MRWRRLAGRLTSGLAIAAGLGLAGAALLLPPGSRADGAPPPRELRAPAGAAPAPPAPAPPAGAVGSAPAPAVPHPPARDRPLVPPGLLDPWPGSARAPVPGPPPCKPPWASPGERSGPPRRVDLNTAGKEE